MDAAQQVLKFKEFIEQNYMAELMANMAQGNHFLKVNFSYLSAYDPELANLLLDTPEDVIKAGELAIEQFDLEKEKPVRVRFGNLPLKEKVPIRNVRSEHLGKFVVIDGIVRQKSDVRPQIEKAKFECPQCGTTQVLVQTEKTITEPKKCHSCGYKGKFSLINKDLTDVQGIVLEESSETMDGGEQPKRLNIVLKEDLVAPMTDKKTNPGSYVRAFGILKEIVQEARNGSQKLVKYDIVLETNNIEPLEEDYSSIKITKQEEREIINLSQDPRVFDKLVNSLAPGIYGHERVKEAILLQFLGGVQKSRSDGVKNRGDVHVLLIGDPGSGKSQLLKRAAVISPKGKYVSGKGASGAGLCVSPKSRILTNPGGIETIEKKLDPRMKNAKRFNSWVLKEDKNIDFKVQSMSHNLKLHSKKPSSLWKLEAPKNVYNIKLKSGKEIELTGNTQLFSIEKGICNWKKSSDLEVGEYVATPRKLCGGDISKINTLDLINSNPVVHNIKDEVKKIAKKLLKNYGSLRNAAQELKIPEGSLYYNWTNKKARGNIKLNNLKLICDKTKTSVYDLVKEVSLYNGKKHKLPKYLSKDFLYVAGILAGDGDLRKSGKTISIRLSNKNEKIHSIFQKVLSKEFGFKYDVQKGNCFRPKATRVHSKLLGEILSNLGIPFSPKSGNIAFSEKLLHLKNKLLAEYIAGLFDSDGCISKRKTKGSDSIEFYSGSEELVKQLQLILMRFEIRARIRERPASSGIIKGKLNRFVLEIRGSENFANFKKNIFLRNDVKKKNLANLESKKTVTNIDIVPGIQKYLKEKGIKHNNYNSNIPYNKLKEISRKTSDKNIKKLANSDIFWEKIVSIEKKTPEYDYVYDLTVEESHNFIVDGVLVHNTAAVVRDEFMGGWALEAGALVLANKGVCMIDELDKMTHEDRSAMHEALEQQSVTISKANIQATLRCETTVLAAANPKLGRFDPFDSLAKQIDLPPALVNRFDLIFPFRDEPDSEKDEIMAKFILNMHKDREVKAPDIDTDLLRKYIIYARQKVQPVLTEAAMEEIKKYYVQMRNSNSDSSIKAIPISARQLEALIRLTESSARIRLSEKATKRDAQKAIDLLHFCLTQVGIDKDTGKFDIDQITTGVTSSQRGKIITIREMIKDLEGKIGKEIPLKELAAMAETRGIKRDELDEIIEKLKRSGDIFEPNSESISRI